MFSHLSRYTYINRFQFQVPAGVEDRSSPAWNGGHVYISSDAVADAYLTQFKQDFAAFLGARAEEIIPGGCMFTALLARNSADRKEQSGLGACAFHLEAAFQELVNQVNCIIRYNIS